MKVTARYPSALAQCFAGRLRECLAVAEEGLALAQGDLALGASQLGISPSIGLSALHGLVLSLTGHPLEGGGELDRAIEFGRAGRRLGLIWGAHGYQVFRCEVIGDAASALTHARSAVEYAERTGSHLGQTLVYLMLGLVNVLNRAWHDALEALEQVLAIGKQRRLLLWEGGALAAIAAAHLGLGDGERALALTEEAIAVSRRRGTRLREFSALLTRVRALRELHGVQATEDIETTLAEADAWLEMSGAKSYEPFLHVERAELAKLRGDEATRQRELREAHHLFLEIGAPIRADEVAKELAS